jgi:hypothetical protein
MTLEILNPPRLARYLDRHCHLNIVQHFVTLDALRLVHVIQPGFWHS